MKLTNQYIVRDNSPPNLKKIFLYFLKTNQMKTIAIFTLITLFLSFSSSGQITKKNWIIGGNAGFSSTNYKSVIGSKSTFTILQISPNVGCFIIDKLATGLRVSLYNSNQKATGTSTSSKYNTNSFGPFIRYYFLKKSSQTNLLFETSYQYGIEKGDSYKNKKNIFSFASGPVIYLNTVVGIEFLVGYSTTKYVGYTRSNNTVQVNIGLQIHLEKEK